MAEESVLIVCDPPARLHSQEDPSTNTVAIAVIASDNSLLRGLGTTEIRDYFLTLCQLAVGGENNGEIQSVNMDLYESARLVKVTFFDARNAFKCQQWLQQNSDSMGLNVVLDFKGGSNRSIVIPVSPNLSIDAVVEKFTRCGDVEKIWLNPDKSLTIDFYDARSVLRVAEHLAGSASLRHTQRQD
jgi:hypothetical protein